MFIVGLLIGGSAGIVLAALCVASAERSRHD